MRLLGLAIVAAGLVGAAGTGAAAYEDDAEFRVTAEGAAFDRWSVSHGATLEYTARPLDGDNASYARRYLSTSERHSGWAAFHEASDRYPDGYCVTWVRLDRHEWGQWMDGPACTEPEEPAPAETEEPPDESHGGSGADPTMRPQPTRESTPAAGTRETPDPEPTRSEPEPTPDPTPSAPSPSPSASPSAEPSPVVSTERNDPASSIVRSFGRPASADDESPPAQAAGLVWIWVILGGIGAAAGGALLMMFRRPL